MNICIAMDNTPIPTTDLNEIKTLFLNVVASKDDLITPASSKALSNATGSSDKTFLEFDSGHESACIGSKAHTQLWPKVE
jgi:poly(3-hydroxyalkanoate) synthetase